MIFQNPEQNSQKKHSRSWCYQNLGYTPKVTKWSKRSISIFLSSVYGVLTFEEIGFLEWTHFRYPFIDIIYYRIRDGSKFMGYPGRDHRHGAKNFFDREKRGGDFFSKNIRGTKRFISRKKGAKAQFWKSTFHFSKKAIFELGQVTRVC